MRPCILVFLMRYQKNRKLFSALFLWFSFLGLSAEEYQFTRLPNIVHIVADDIGYDDLSCYDSKDIKTPNLDRVAREGMRFTSFYAPSPVGTASRAAMLTGFYPQRIGLSQTLYPYSKTGLHSNEVTIAELLKSRGYITACIGKWHLGHHPEFLPTQHGFDYFYGIPYSKDHGPERLGWEKLAGTVGYRNPPVPLMRGTNIVESPAMLAALPERFAEEATKFMLENLNKPFYLHLAPVETHIPWLTTPAFHYKSAAGVFGDAVECVDWMLDEIMTVLDEMGLSENTLLVFSSDNGPLVHRNPELESIYGHAGHVRQDRVHLLREGKHQGFYEGGVRVPLLMRWLGKIPPQSICNEIVAGFDLFTTFATMAGIKPSAEIRTDGKNILPLMFARPGARSPHEAFFYYQEDALNAVRSGPWKLIFGELDNKGKMMHSSRDKLFLYNLETDLSERNNLADQNPEIVLRLQKMADQMREDLGDTRRGMPGKNRRKAGTILSP
ncbi:MAG: sulfatase [Verrucomicrobiota bacterium]|nr:sulfatase [Verrucomicrobiota bacterium]